MSALAPADIDALVQADRINVVGTSGSGKSTFSQTLAEIKGVPCIEMDRLFWKPEWQESTDDEFFARLTAETSADGWVLDGNYHRTKAIKWARAQTVVYLDLPFVPTIFQLIGRCLERSRSGKEIWPGTGNRETLSKTFLSRDSVVWWAATHHGSNRKRYLSNDSFTGFPHIRFVHLTSRDQIARCLEAVSASVTKGVQR